MSLLLVVALALGGCESLMPSGKKIEYKSVSAAPALEIPPDLTTPTYDDRYQVATASGQAAAKAIAKPSEVLPASGEARMERSGSERWLVVKTTPDNAWKVMREFWTKNGFVVAVEQPALGIMETDWAENRASVPDDFFHRTVGKYADIFYDTYKRDKFRTRIETGNEFGTVEIYISHRGAEQVPTVKIDNSSPAGFVWAPTAHSSELEAEFLQRAMVAFGTPSQTAKSVLETAISAPERARLETDAGVSRLVVDDSFDRAWRRVGLALDRTGFTVVDRDRSKGLYFVRFADPDGGATKPQEGFLDKLKFWKSEPKDKPEQYRVLITEADPNSFVTVQNPSGGPEKSTTGDKILSLLKDQLK